MKNWFDQIFFRFLLPVTDLFYGGNLVIIYKQGWFRRRLFWRRQLSEEETTFKDIMSIPTGYLTCGRYWRRRYWRGRFWRRHQFLFRENPIQYQMRKIALTISLHNLTEFLITKIRINNFVTQIDEIPYWRVKTEERRRRFQKSLRNIQDIHCRNFALHISLYNLTKFRVIQFDEISRYTNFASHNLTKFRKLEEEEEEINSGKEEINCLSCLFVQSVTTNQ